MSIVLVHHSLCSQSHMLSAVGWMEAVADVNIKYLAELFPHQEWVPAVKKLCPILRIDFFSGCL